MPLQLGYVVVENLAERRFVERLVGDDHVDAIEEFGREPFPHRREPNAFQSVRDFGARA